MILGLATLGVVVASTGSGFAQNGAAKPAAAPPAAPPSIPAVSSEPTVTTASFGDWTLRCQRIVDAARAARVCEVAQVLQAQGQQAPLAQVALGRLANGEPVRITAVMPASVSFPGSVGISM